MIFVHHLKRSPNLVKNILFFIKKNETIATKINARTIERIRATHAKEGHQFSKIPCPMPEPTRPATMFASYPIDSPFLVMATAITPITVPTTNDQINPMNITSLL